MSRQIVTTIEAPAAVTLTEELLQAFGAADEELARGPE